VRPDLRTIRKNGFDRLFPPFVPVGHSYVKCFPATGFDQSSFWWHIKSFWVISSPHKIDNDMVHF